MGRGEVMDGLLKLNLDSVKRSSRRRRMLLFDRAEGELSIVSWYNTKIISSSLSYIDKLTPLLQIA